MKLRRRCCCVVAAVVGFAVTGQAKAGVIADSVAEFSGAQGQDNWYYGYWDRTSDSDGVYDPVTDFQPMTQFIIGPSINFGHQADTHAPAWFVQDGSFWTALWREGGHPSGTNGNQGRLPFEHWTTRRWISEVGGIIHISGYPANHPNYGGLSDARILIDGTEIWSAHINSPTPVTYGIDAVVSWGSKIDLMIDPHMSSDVSDQPYFTATITPEPTNAALMVYGLTVAFGRRARRHRSSSVSGSRESGRGKE